MRSKLAASDLPQVGNLLSHRPPPLPDHVGLDGRHGGEEVLVGDEGVAQPVVVGDRHGMVDEEVDKVPPEDHVLLGLQHGEVVRGGRLAARLDLLHLDVEGLRAEPGKRKRKRPREGD